VVVEQEGPAVNAIATCSTGRWQQRLLSAPPITWLAVLAAAHWTHWRWAAARLSDGSDDPLGLAAVLVLVWALVKHAGELRAQPRPLWLGVAMGLSVTATAAVWWLPPLVGALLAALALASGVRAFMPSGRATWPLAGLAVLALPLVSSMQFYAGYPLRVVTAELSTWGLRALGFVAERTGSAMQVDGQLIIVDAPCSGVQMVWMAYFCACTMALWRDLRDAQFLRRLPFIGLLVLLGNVLRNTVLVGLQASHVELTEWAHQGVGLLVLALVCAAVCGLMAVRPPQAEPTAPAIRGLYGLD
jgi:exosortase/archaeosortase family protein